MFIPDEIVEMLFNLTVTKKIVWFPVYSSHLSVKFTIEIDNLRFDLWMAEEEYLEVFDLRTNKFVFTISKNSYPSLNALIALMDGRDNMNGAMEVHRILSNLVHESGDHIDVGLSKE